MRALMRASIHDFGVGLELKGSVHIILPPSCRGCFFFFFPLACRVCALPCCSILIISMLSTLLRWLQLKNFFSSNLLWAYLTLQQSFDYLYAYPAALTATEIKFSFSFELAVGVPYPAAVFWFSLRLPCCTNCNKNQFFFLCWKLLCIIENQSLQIPQVNTDLLL